MQRAAFVVVEDRCALESVQCCIHWRGCSLFRTPCFEHDCHKASTQMAANTAYMVSHGRGGMDAGCGQLLCQVRDNRELGLCMSHVGGRARYSRVGQHDIKQLYNLYNDLCYQGSLVVFRARGQRVAELCHVSQYVIMKCDEHGHVVMGQMGCSLNISKAADGARDRILHSSM